VIPDYRPISLLVGESAWIPIGVVGEERSSAFPVLGGAELLIVGLIWICGLFFGGAPFSLFNLLFY